MPSGDRCATQEAVQTQINELDKRITQAHRANEDSKRLDDIPGVRPDPTRRSWRR